MRTFLRGFLSWIWDLQESLLVRFWGLQDVRAGEGGLFRVRVAAYRGKKFTLKDGTTIAPGQLVGELHFRNDTLRSLHEQATGSRQVGWLFREALIAGLRDLAGFVTTSEEYKQLPAFYGVTLLHYGAEKLGFEVRPLPPNLRTRLLRGYQAVLTARHHPAGSRRVQQGTRMRQPAEVWISRQALLSQYGSE